MFLLTPGRRAVLLAVADTFIPAGEGVGGLPPGSAMLDLEQVMAAIQAQPLGAQQEFGQLLDLLGRPLLGFTWLGPLRPFGQLAPAQREQVLLSWSSSRLPLLRKGFQRCASCAPFCTTAVARPVVAPIRPGRRCGVQRRQSDAHHHGPSALHGPAAQG